MFEVAGSGGITEIVIHSEALSSCMEDLLFIYTMLVFW
jgi:hypothetical protein